jgi:Protein of unknown function (DUF2865)
VRDFDEEPMQRPFYLARVLLSLVIVVTSQFMLTMSAFANTCRSIESELSTFSRKPSGREQQIANRNAEESARLISHMRSIGCERQSFLFFGQPPPPECGGYRARLSQIQSRPLETSGNNEGRRRQLLSMLVSYNCRTSPDTVTANRSGPLTGGLFDDGSRRSELEVRPDFDTVEVEKPRVRSVGGKAVCVRLCDGFYFPLHIRGASLRDDGDGLCRSLCPATETKMFMMPRSIDTAVTTDGENYTEIPNAFRYRKSFDPSCFCRKPGEIWGENHATILNPENNNRAGFGIVNPDSEGLILDEEADLRGMIPVPGKKRDPRLFGARPPPEPPAPAHPPIELPADRTVSADQGEVKEFKAKDGTTRTVRVVAPELLRAPSEAKEPLIPGRAPSR